MSSAKWQNVVLEVMWADVLPVSQENVVCYITAVASFSHSAYYFHSRLSREKAIFNLVLARYSGRDGNRDLVAILTRLYWFGSDKRKHLI